MSQAIFQLNRHTAGEGMFLMNSFSQFPTNPSQPTSHITSLHRQRLEKLWVPTSSTTAPAPTAQPAITAWLKQVGTWLLNAMTNSQQLRIWTQITPNGLQWHAYDPSSGHKFLAQSEEELRIWLETRHQRG